MLSNSTVKDVSVIGSTPGGTRGVVTLSISASAAASSSGAVVATVAPMQQNVSVKGTEIDNAVCRVLQEYDWTVVPIATK